jgi:acetylornithine/N-succinyldiaminopimelate aminotransferase
MNIAEIMQIDDQYHLNTFGRRTPISFTSGSGVYLQGCDGKTYLDLLGGIAVNILGHNNAHLVEAVCEQAGKLIHCSNLYYIESQAELAKRLVRKTGMERAFFCNSGGEANEAAIKLVRGYYHNKNSGRFHFYSALNSFHGRTLATVTATGQPKYNKPFAPLPEGFSYIPYNDLDALEACIRRPDTAGVILELVQGESGVHPATQAYAEAAEHLCRKHGVQLIVDEIQTGMGRTGEFLSTQTYGIRADVITMAKGLAGGVPIGALLARGPVCAGFTPGSHGTTFGGNPLACTAALATLDEYERLELGKRARTLGDRLLNDLTALQQQRPQSIAAVRGKGLMLAIDLTEAAGTAQQLRDRFFEQQILVNATGPQTLRLLPPLIIEDEHLDHFLRTLEALLTQTH